MFLHLVLLSGLPFLGWFRVVDSGGQAKEKNGSLNPELCPAPLG